MAARSRGSTGRKGQYDVVSIVDAPDEASFTALAMSVGKLGYVRTQTLRAFAAAELAPIMDKVVWEDGGRVADAAERARDPTASDVAAARQAKNNACFQRERLREAVHAVLSRTLEGERPTPEPPIMRGRPNARCSRNRWRARLN